MGELDQLVRKTIRDLKPYSSAREEFSGAEAVFLDANENPFGTLNRYPDPFQKELKGAFSERYQIDSSKLFIGNGSDEIIDLVFRVFCEGKQDKALCFSPTYGMYEVVAAIHQVALIQCPLDADFEIDLDTLQPHLQDSDLKLLLLCSPNNPTGNCISESLLRSILDDFKGIVLVDEAYIDFAPECSMLGLLDDYERLILCRTMSKAWGLASARIGWAIADERMIAYLNKVKPPYNISLLNQEAAILALKHGDVFEENRKAILQEREALVKALSTLPYVKKIYPSQANFLLVEMEDAAAVYQHLVSKKIIVRNRSQQIANCLRISIGTQAENEVLIAALKEWNNEKSTFYR